MTDELGKPEKLIVPTVDDFEVSDAMIAQGGGFVRTLGHLWRQGDDDNRARIKAAWPEYWEQYRRLALGARYQR